MGSYLEASLQHDMDLIRTHVRTMAERCERAIRTALGAMAEGKRQDAYLVILGDQRVDDAEQQLDRLCLEFLVRQQPAGAHLRFAYAAIKDQQRARARRRSRGGDRAPPAEARLASA